MTLLGQLTSDRYVETIKKFGVNLPTEVNVLGQKYRIVYSSEEYDPDLKDLSGLCDFGLKTIKIEQDIYLDCRENIKRFAATVFHLYP